MLARVVAIGLKHAAVCNALLMIPACTVSQDQSSSTVHDLNDRLVVESFKPVGANATESNDSKSRLIDLSGREHLELKPKCRVLIAKADLDAAILSAPTLAASVDEEGDTQVSLSYDLINMSKIGMNRETALVRCEINNLSDSARALQKLSARSLTKQGLLARIKFIDGKSHRINQIRAELNTAVASGEIKEKAQERVLKTIAALLERIDALRGRARLQEHISFDDLPNYIALEQAFLAALTEQHFLKKKSDLSKNVRLTLSGGYQFENEDDEPTSDEESEAEFFGRASLSVRLGVLTPAWRQKKHEELQAEIDQLYQPKTGQLWRVNDTYQKNRISISTLQDKRLELANKIAIAKRRKAALPIESRADNVLLEIEIMKLQSELVEVETNLNVLAKAQQKLRN